MSMSRCMNQRASRFLTASIRRHSFQTIAGSQPVPAVGTKAESFARERKRPIEPAPGNAGEGSDFKATQVRITRANYGCEQRFS